MRRLNTMVSFRQKLMTAAMILGVSVSVFAQKGGDNSNKRPPKDPPKVVVTDKEKPPPQGDKKGDKKGKP
jgi:hypothetical protein